MLETVVQEMAARDGCRKWLQEMGGRCKWGTAQEMAARVGGGWGGSDLRQLRESIERDSV